MTPTPRCAGLDWGSAKTALALWEANATQMVPSSTSSLGLFPPAAVGFRQPEGRGRDVEVVFPAAADAPRRPGELVFEWLKRTLPRCGSGGAKAFVAAPIFQHWKASAGDVTHLSVAVPLDYAADERDALQRAATRAGFTQCGFVLDVVAAVLAHVPVWQRQKAHWTSLNEGREVWIVDAGHLDLTVCVLQVQYTRERLSVSIAAADRLPYLGGHYASTPAAGAAASAVESSARHLLALSRSRRPGDGAGPSAAPPWIVPCGGAPARDDALRALHGVLPSAIAWQEFDPREVHARGAAVHAACRAGVLPHVVSTGKRSLIGLFVGPAEGEFAALTTLADQPPCDFEGAFALEAGEGHPFELALAAAPPGGGLTTGLLTWVLDGADAARVAGRVVLVRGRLETWSGGIVELLDAERGDVLRRSEFHVL